MAVGYAFGPVFPMEAERRQQLLLRSGTGLVAAFVVLRALNVYGDPHRWVSQPSPVFTLLDFLNCTKYPPSLLYLLMTLGPALFALYVFERHAQWAAGRIGQVFVTFGRVPLFYYLLHVPLIHFIAIALAFARYGSQVTHFSQNNLPPDYGFDSAHRVPGLAGRGRSPVPAVPPFRADKTNAPQRVAHVPLECGLGGNVVAGSTIILRNTTSKKDWREAHQWKKSKFERASRPRLQELPVPKPQTLFSPLDPQGDSSVEIFQQALAGKNGQSLSAEFFAKWWAWFGYLTPDAYRYYVAAFLMAALNELQDNKLVYSAVSVLSPSFWSLYYEGDDSSLPGQSIGFHRIRNIAS